MSEFSSYTAKLLGGRDIEKVSFEEWQQWYLEKEELLHGWYGSSVPWRQFYRELFPAGSMQPFNAWVDDSDHSLGRVGSWKDVRAAENGNAIILREDVRRKRNGEVYRTRKKLVVYEDRWDEAAPFLCGNSKSLIAPITFWGQRMSSKMAHELFAIVLDVDYVCPENLRNLENLFCAVPGFLAPSYLVNSGRGVHLYFFLKEPVRLYNNTKKILTNLKNALVEKYWFDATSLRPFQPDVSSIVQSFRCVGGWSKLSSEINPFSECEYEVTAYKCSNRRFSLYELAELVGVNVDPIFQRPKGRLYDTMPLEKAKELYPEWYERLEKESREAGLETDLLKPNQRKKKQFRYVTHRRVYDAFLKRLLSGKAVVGGRYFAVCSLCSFGVKCAVPIEEIKRDCEQVFPVLAGLTVDTTNQFTKADLHDAMKMLDSEHEEIALHTTRKWIEDRTHIKFDAPIPRNGRKQREHLQAELWVDSSGKPKTNTCRTNRELALKYLKGKGVLGRKSCAEQVAAWRAENPDRSKEDCMRETGLSRTTVYKWWKQ